MVIVDLERAIPQSGSRIAALVVLVAFTLGGLCGYVVGTTAPLHPLSSADRLVQAVIPSKPAESSGAEATDRGHLPPTPSGSALEEMNRRIATCDTALNDQLEYCSGTGSWASPHPTGVRPELTDAGLARLQ